MHHPDYLIHFNKLHSRKNGQFVSGDGDSDGKIDEHHRYTNGQYSITSRPTQKKSNYQDGPVTKGMANIGLKLIGGFAKWQAGRAFCRTKFGYGLTTTWAYTKKYANLDNIFKDVHIGDIIGTDKLKVDVSDKMAEKTASTANKLYKKYLEE